MPTGGGRDPTDLSLSQLEKGSMYTRRDVHAEHSVIVIGDDSIARDQNGKKASESEFYRELPTDRARILAMKLYKRAVEASKLADFINEHLPCD